MSGIDEGISFCPECAKLYGAMMPPSYWTGECPVGGNIWLLSDRFRVETENAAYKSFSVMFSPRYDELIPDYFVNIEEFSCGWTSLDKKMLREGRESMYIKQHRFRKGSSVYDRLMRQFEYNFERTGGCFLK